MNAFGSFWVVIPARTTLALRSLALIALWEIFTSWPYFWAFCWYVVPGYENFRFTSFQICHEVIGSGVAPEPNRCL